MSASNLHTEAGHSGILLIDKPAGITSFDCIRRLRKTLGIKKIGHAGTLDPMATGLMIMLVGKATKRAGEFIKQDKSYLAEITLGANSDTGDKEGEIKEISDKQPTIDEVRLVVDALVGRQTQVPSRYSAIKIGGVPAYKLARAGKEPQMPAREVEVYSIKMLHYDYPLIKIEFLVSSGTYIRSLAEDIGLKLGTGAYLSDLRRTTIGRLNINQAKKLDEVRLGDINRDL